MKYPQYTYPIDKLPTGCSLGNYFLFARFDRESNLKGLWCAEDNQFYIGEWNIDVEVDGVIAIPQSTEFLPESQSTIFRASDVIIEKKCFLPFYTDQEADLHADEMHACIYFLTITNLSSTEKSIVIRNTVVFPGVHSGLFTKQPLDDQVQKLVHIHQHDGYCEIKTSGNPNEARIIGSSHPWTLSSMDDRSLIMEYSFMIKGNAVDKISYTSAISPESSAKAFKNFQKCVHPRLLLEQSMNNYREVLERSFLFTPEPVINRGLQWAKINTVRVQHRYNIGEGFTNDPPQDIIVIRDLAWFVFGSDYLSPQFSRNILSLGERFAYHEGGKLTEYVHANETLPAQHDYHLNINDDTPLFVNALYHHALTCNDDLSSEKIYPLMQKACDWIISQIKNGLVQGYSDGTNVWGIFSWRNIIDNYNLSGAVTEINAECYYALKCTADIASHIGKQDDSGRYRNIAETLKREINTRLVSEKTGLYLLNIDNGGNRHHDITGDLIFPVLFDVADSEMQQRILQRLTDEEMWTPYGSRTVSKREQNYDPDFGYQLVGGVWHNLTAWIAYCIRKKNPEKLIEGMKNIFRLSEVDTPREYGNVVPGQFPERIHGESYISRGMAMSPWMPPTYLWLGIEGLLGVTPSADGCEINPAMPSSWQWIAVKNLFYKKEKITLFIYAGVLYTTSPVQSRYPQKVGTPVDTSSSQDDIFSIGLVIEKDLFLFVASDVATQGTVVIEILGSRIEKEIRLNASEARILKFSVPNIILQVTDKEFESP